jgi:hypothetical protein
MADVHANIETFQAVLRDAKEHLQSLNARGPERVRAFHFLPLPKGAL